MADRTNMHTDRGAEPGGRLRTGLTRRERGVGLISGFGLVLLFALFHFISIESAVIAQGQVVVQGKPRPVQTLEGGIVSQVHVRDGDTVAAGQVVVQLDASLAGINRDIVRNRLAELIAQRTRLEAERKQLDRFPPVHLNGPLTAGEVSTHLAVQQELFQSRREVLQNEQAQLKERVEQHEAQITGLEAQVEATENQIDLITREVGNLEKLFAQGLVPESRLLELQGRRAGLVGQVALHRSEVLRMRNAIRDAELEAQQTGREFRETVVSELRDVMAGISENTLELARHEELLQQVDIRTPVSGIVHELQVWTSGGVVSPQATLMTVIPVSDGVEFEVKIAPDAIDTVHLGQKARIRFPSFDQRSTPELTGTISNVSPDSVADPKTGASFYRVDVSLPEEELTRLGAADLIPGMPVEAFLRTGDRSILSFLIKPLADQLSYAFREG